MGRKLDALLGRKSKTSKLKNTLNLAISHLAILNNHRRARFTIAYSDLIQLLHLNHHEQALLRVEQVIKDQNMLDVYAMVNGYCLLLIQRINLIDQANDCPEELKEAASSILYAAPRCGEFPELQEIRRILTTLFGRDFADGSIDLRSNCGVNQKIIQKLSPKQSSLECRLKTLTEIAKENSIVLQLEKTYPEIIKEKLVTEKKPSQLKSEATVLPKKIEKVLSLSESMKKYMDVEEAAQDAFESAAYAAAAARAAVELVRSESFDSVDLDSPNSRPKKMLNSESMKSKLHTSDFDRIGYENGSSTPRYDSESEYEDERSKYNMKAEEINDLYPDNYSDDEDDSIKSVNKKMVFDKMIKNEEMEFPARNAHFSSYKQFPARHQANPKSGLDPENPESHFGKVLKMHGVQQLDIENNVNFTRPKRLYGR
uniref:uncharacterized protein LOC122581674 n=1 Tax=Erigeron canadensis TaxID=72917 RepID=UPI001CB9C17B|nr:uncharacterized protein LOC122581674 [Erigeron canadensis]